MLDERTRYARTLFEGISTAYAGPAELLSFAQYGRWRRALVRALPLRENDLVLDVATGTGLIARDIASRHSSRVVGVDQSEPMMAHARRNVRELVAADANGLPFADERFDAVVFSYLLRYVKDPPATLAEIVRVLKPGGTLASVEFGVPRSLLPRLGWRAHAQGVMPVVARAFGKGWREVGEFLPRSIVEWSDQWPIERQIEMWRAAGLVEMATKHMLFGTGVLIKGRKREG